MLLAVTFMFPTAMALKSRSAWHKIKEENDRKLEQFTREQQELKYGDPSNPQTVGGVIPLSRLLAKVELEAGRRWRSLQMQNVQEQTITLAKAAAEPAVGIPGEETAVEADSTPMAPEQLIVYGFAESPNEQQVMLPTFFLGEFVVTTSTPDSITIQPSAPLEEQQLQAIQDGQAASWSLYELLPIDGHSMFIAEGSAPTDENFLGRVDDELVKQLFADRLTEKTLESYLRDGSKSTPADPPLSRWTKVLFEKAHTVEVDSKEQRGALDGGFFDGVGRAVDGRLQKGGDVEFKKGDEWVFKEEEANRLIDEGIATLVDEFYLRPLNDYRYILRRIRLRLTELDNRMNGLRYESEVLQSAVDNTENMLVAKQDIRLKLEQDLEHYKKETAAIGKFVETLKGRTDEMRAEMQRLYRHNSELERQLRRYHDASGPVSPSDLSREVASLR